MPVAEKYEMVLWWLEYFVMLRFEQLVAEKSSLVMVWFEKSELV